MAKRPTEDRSEGSGVGGSGDSKGCMREARVCREMEGRGGIGVYKLVARCALGAEHGTRTASHSVPAVAVCMCVVCLCACMHSGTVEHFHTVGMLAWAQDCFTANQYAVFICCLQFHVSLPAGNPAKASGPSIKKYPLPQPCYYSCLSIPTLHNNYCRRYSYYVTRSHKKVWLTPSHPPSQQVIRSQNRSMLVVRLLLREHAYDGN